MVVKRLIIRPGAIGDFIVSIPAMESLRAGPLEVWAASPNLPLARFADRTRPIASTGLDLLGVAEPPARLLAALAAFDEIVSWYGSNRRDLRELVASLGLPFRFLDALPPEGVGMHAVDFYLRQVGAAPGANPRIECPAAPADFAAIHPFSGGPKKNWPLEHFLELAKTLPMPVELLCGPEDDLAGATRLDNLYELARRLAGARIYIGNDSGITHLAAAVGTPVIALFGPTDPAVWAPRGAHVQVLPLSSAPESVRLQVCRHARLLP